MALVFGSRPEAQAQSGEQPGSRHGQVGFLWQQPSLGAATVDGETASDAETSLEKEGRSLVATG